MLSKWCSLHNAQLSTFPREEEQRSDESRTLAGLPWFPPRRHIFFFLINDSCNPPPQKTKSNYNSFQTKWVPWAASAVWLGTRGGSDITKFPSRWHFHGLWTTHLPSVYLSPAQLQIFWGQKPGQRLFDSLVPGAVLGTSYAFYRCVCFIVLRVWQ